jgi:MFS transporter, DHA1 family, multidrug resistance protein
MKLRPDTFALTAVLGLLTALGPLSTDMYLPSLPDISVKLAAGTAQTQLTLSVFLLGFAAGQVVYGPFSDRFGRKPVLLFGLGAFLLATALCAVSTSIEMLIGARFLQAFGASGPIVLARAVVRDLYEGPRAGRELARMGTVMGVVPALAPLLGGVLQTTFGWRASFVAALVGGAALGAVVVLLLPETLRTAGKASLSPVGIVRGFETLWRHRAYRVYVGLSALAYGGLFSFISGSSFVLQGVYGLGEIAYSLSFTFPVLGFIAGTVLARRLVLRLGFDGTIGVGVACLSVAGVTMAALVGAGMASSLAITIPMALYCCGVGLVMPQAMAAAMQPFPDRAGAASSFLGLIQMTSAAFVGAALGQALNGQAWPLPFAVALLGLMALGLFAATRSIRARGA